MLQLLNFREFGIESPRVLERAHRTARSHLIQLSMYRGFEIDPSQKGAINSIDLDPVEGRYLLTGASDGGVSIFDVEHTSSTPKQTYKTICHVSRKSRHSHKKSISRVQWYPFDTGMFLTCATDQCLKVWDTNRMVPAEVFPFDWLIYSHDISPTSTQHSLVALASQKSLIALVDLRTGSKTHTLRGHQGNVYCVKWSPRDEYIIASGGADNKSMLWDVRSSKGHCMVFDQHNGDSSAGPQSVNTAHCGRVNGLEFTYDGQHLVTTGTDQRIRLWDARSGKNLLVNYGKVENSSRNLVQFAVSKLCEPDLIYIPQSSDIKVYNLHSGEHIQTLTGHFSKVNCVIYDSAYQELYSGANDRNILVYSPNIEMEAVYKEHHDRSQTSVSRGISSGYVRRIGRADAWSSDED